MRQKLLSWGDDFYVKDEAGNDGYFVDGKALSFGDQLSFQDLEPRCLYGSRFTVHHSRAVRFTSRPTSC